MVVRASQEWAPSWGGVRVGAPGCVFLFLRRASLPIYTRTVCDGESVCSEAIPDGHMSQEARSPNHGYSVLHSGPSEAGHGDSNYRARRPTPH